MTNKFIKLFKKSDMSSDNPKSYEPVINHNKLMTTLNQKWRNKKCPMCQENNWAFDMDMTALNNLTSDYTVPLVIVGCCNCGNTLFINPITIDCLNGYSK